MSLHNGEGMYQRIISILLAIAIGFFLSASKIYEPKSTDGINIKVAAADNGKNYKVKSQINFQDVLYTPAKMSHLADKSLLNGIYFTGKRIVSVGIRGHIIYSDDKGKTWIQAKVPVSSDLTSVYFPTPQKGWAVGHDGVVLHSHDGGTTWIKQLDGNGVCRIIEEYYRVHPIPGVPSSTEAEKLKDNIDFIVSSGAVNPFLDVYFENESNGFIVGAFNLILHTTDGGKTWESWFDRTDNPDGLHLYSITCIGEDMFVSGEQGLIMKLNHQSNRLEKIELAYKGTFFGVMGKPGLVITFGMRGNVFRSKDSGRSWQKVSLGSGEGILGGTITEKGSIVLVTQGGNVLMSEDDGESFTAVMRNNGVGIPLHAVAAVIEDTLALASWVGIQLEKVR